MNGDVRSNRSKKNRNKDSPMKMDPNIINEDDLYGGRESFDSESSDSNLDALDSLISDSSDSFQVVTAMEIPNEASFELDKEGNWKKKIPPEHLTLIERYQRLDELIKTNKLL